MPAPVREKVVFTKTSVAALDVPKTGRVYYYDAKQAALACCVTATGKRTFYCIRRIDGQPTRLMLGEFPEWTVENARTAAARKLGEIASGKNPQREKIAARHEHTMSGLWDHWLARAKDHKKTWSEDERLYKNFLEKWKTRRLSTITKQDIQQLHSSLGTDHGRYCANRVLSLIRAMFNQAEDIGYTGANPTGKIKKFTEQSRDRFLRPEEIPAFFNALAAEGDPYRDFFMLCLLTGARRGNVQSMQWRDIHADAATWRIPVTKNGEPVVVHLPAKALEILERRKPLVNSIFVFPGADPTKHISQPKKAWLRITTAACIENLRIHDLRRTLGSWQAIAGSSLTVIGASLGHKSQSATAVYARLSQAPVVQSVNSATDAILAAAEPNKDKPKTEPAKPKRKPPTKTTTARKQVKRG